jgi:hypothetical protein
LPLNCASSGFSFGAAASAVGGPAAVALASPTSSLASAALAAGAAALAAGAAAEGSAEVAASCASAGGAKPAIAAAIAIVSQKRRPAPSFMTSPYTAAERDASLAAPRGSW